MEINEFNRCKGDMKMGLEKLVSVLFLIRVIVFIRIYLLDWFGLGKLFFRNVFWMFYQLFFRLWNIIKRLIVIFFKKK
jgi:hypothetical protein